MRASMQKLFRDTLEQKVISQYKKQFLNYDQYANRLRFPSTPKIVVYSHAQGLQTYLEQVFPLYKYITPSASSGRDELIARQVAEELLGATGTEFGGFILKGFPFNTNQALLLDRYINGVNLAVHIRAENEQEDDSINNLLNYYDQRGTLVRLPFINNPNAEQLEFITREIVSNIKLNE